MQITKNGYFVHRFGPTDLPPIPVHCIFVLDVSGSMIGDTGENAKNAIISIFKNLKEDRNVFNIITFSTEIQVKYFFQSKLEN